MSPTLEFDSFSTMRIPATSQAEAPGKKIASTEAPVPAYYQNPSPYRVTATPSLPQPRTESPAAKPPVSVRVISPAVLSQDDNTVKECLPTLLRWDRPDLREKAAIRLGEIDGRQFPEVVEALRGAAVNDGAIDVRIACIRSLAKAGSGCAEVGATLEKLKLDPDRGIREAAGDALDMPKGR